MQIKYLLIMIGIFLMIGTVLAVADNPIMTFKVNTKIDLTQGCSNCTYVTLTTIQFPNGTIQTINKNMTKSDTEYNYTYYFSQLGKHEINGIDDIDGEVEVWNYPVMVTTTGVDVGMGSTIPILMLVGAFVLLICGLLLKNEILGLFSGFLFIVSGIYMMIYGLGLFADMYTRTIAYVSLGIGLVIGFIAVIELFYQPLGVTGDGDND